MAKRKIVSSVPDSIPFPISMPIKVATLSRSQAKNFDIHPDASEKAEIAKFLGIAGLSDFRFKGQILGDEDEGWLIKGRLTAKAVQKCVITLDDVPESIDEAVQRKYVPESEEAAAGEIDLDPDTDDDPDFFTDAVDPSHLALEALSLALDPYPRAENADLDQTGFAAPGVKPLTDDDVKPFAGLAELKEKLAKK